MAMIVKVQWEDGSPCIGTRVCAWINEEGNSEVYTDSNGEAYFDYGPGTGTIYCDGNKVINECRLGSKVLITCKSNGLFSYSYY